MGRQEESEGKAAMWMDLVLILIATLPLMPIARSGGTAQEKAPRAF
jgi:hypothetical protein